MYSYSEFLLALTVGLQAILLKQSLSRITTLKRIYADADADDGRLLPAGKRAPSFSAPVLDDERPLHLDALKGHEALLMFVSPEAAASAFYSHLATALHALCHRYDGHVYVICSGTEQSCRELARTQRFAKVFRRPLPVALDIDGGIARSFRITRTPKAVSLDDTGAVVRYGEPRVGRITSEIVLHTQAPR